MHTDIQAAKEQALNHGTEGIIILDEAYHLLMSNEAAQRMFPELQENGSTINEEIKNLIVSIEQSDENRRRIERNGKILELRGEPMQEGKGWIIWVLDRTEHDRYEERMREFQSQLENKVAIERKKIEEMSLDAILSIAYMIDTKDYYTRYHSIKVSKIAEEITRRMGWNREQVRNIRLVGLLHDIGKIAVPDSILEKTEALTEEEKQIMQKCTLIGNEILKDIKTVPGAAEAALYHHEKYDGTGYPNGLKGREIPVEARIIAIADAYDAMTSERAYRLEMKKREVREEFNRQRGKHFDPEITDIVLQMLEDHFVPDISGVEFDYQDESSRLLHKVIQTQAEMTQSLVGTDGLTGLYNRIYFETTVSRICRQERRGAMYMLDMDSFKYVNDHYGHDIGDLVLCEFANVLQEATRESDVVCRLGGDEFIIFFLDIISRDSMREKAQEIITRFHRRLEEEELPEVTTVSIGIAVAPQDGENFRTLYKSADIALYQAKRNGKNQYYFFENE